MESERRNRTRPDNSFRIVENFRRSSHNARCPQAVTASFNKRLFAAFILKGQFKILGKFFLERKYIPHLYGLPFRQTSAAFLTFFFSRMYFLIYSNLAFGAIINRIFSGFSDDLEFLRQF